MKVEDVVVKATQPLRVAEVRGTAAGLDPAHIGPLFGQLAPKLIEHLQRVGAEPGMLVHYYDDPEEDGSVGVHVAYEIGAQPVPASDGVHIVELAVVQVASVVHKGSMHTVVPVYQALIRWIEDRGFHLVGRSRELYREMGADGPRITELQLPIAK